MGEGGKAKHLADVGEGEAAVAQQTADIKRSVAGYPIVGRQATHLLRHIGEVLSRHAELVGVISYLAVAAKVALLKHLDELFHQLVLL